MASITRHVLTHPPPTSPLPAFAASFTTPLAYRASSRPLPLHLAYLPSSAYTSQCPVAGRSLLSRRALSSKRPLVTSAATAKHGTTESLDQVAPPPPPRNNVASAIPEVNDVRPPSGSQATGSEVESESVAVRTEARRQENTSMSHIQTSTTTLASTAKSRDSPSPEAKTRPKSKLRPLRNAITLTPAAVIHIKALVDQPEPKLLRIGTRRRGCSGLAYHLEYVEKPDKFDEVVRQDGVEVLVEGRALLTVLGSTMDWVDEKLGSRFVFTNPNIKEQCGCGESFMV